LNGIMSINIAIKPITRNVRAENDLVMSF
jgi:hypothetical protein